MWLLLRKSLVKHNKQVLRWYKLFRPRCHQSHFCCCCDGPQSQPPSVVNLNLSSEYLQSLIQSDLHAEHQHEQVRTTTPCTQTHTKHAAIVPSVPKYARYPIFKPNILLFFFLNFLIKRSQRNHSLWRFSPAHLKRLGKSNRHQPLPDHSSNQMLLIKRRQN